MTSLGSSLAPPRFTASVLWGARAVAGLLSLSFFILLCWTIQVHGHPFKSELLTPWMNTTLVDYYLTLAPVCIWGCIRERGSAFRAFLLCLFLCCLGSFAVWAYIFFVLQRLKPGDQVHKLLF